MDFLKRNIGSRDCFSVEFSVQPDLHNPTNEWLGTVCIWANGHCIGNPSEVEMVSIALGSLVNAAKQTVSRVNTFLSSRTASEALDCVLKAIYGAEEIGWLPRKEAVKFEILSAASGPSFDTWVAILLEEGQTERLIYRQEGQPACEARWSIGTFEKVSLSAWEELRGLLPALRDTIQ